MLMLSDYPIDTPASRMGDMDAFGHVNNVLYCIVYMESARIRYMDELNIFQQCLYSSCIKSVQNIFVQYFIGST